MSNKRRVQNAQYYTYKERKKERKYLVIGTCAHKRNGYVDTLVVLYKDSDDKFYTRERL